MTQAAETKPSKRALNLYVAAVIWAGAVAVIDSSRSAAFTPHPLAWLTLSALGLGAGFWKLKFAGLAADIAVDDTFFIATALLLGPAPATLTIAASGLLVRYRRILRQRLFNAATFAISMWCAAHAFFLVAGVQPLATSHAPIAPLILPLVLMTAIFFSLNSGLIAIAVGLDTRQSSLTIWFDYFGWVAVGYFGGASVAFILVLLLQQASVAAVIVVLPLLIAFYLMLSLSFGRTNDAQRHFAAMDRLYLSTVETLAMAIDAKDDVTHSHVRRVQALAMAVARAMGITDDAELKALEAAALLHDTGKLAVPEHILNKPGGLTDAEFEKMKLHVDIGADILSLVGFPFPVVPIVRCHHENWDGSGYPNGIAGEAIPIGARILSVVDCFDALTSDRPYRKRLSDEAAVGILRERSGRMYDPAVVDLFIRIRKDIVLEQDDHGAEHQVMRRITDTRGVAQPVPAVAGSSAEHAPDGLLAFVSLSRLASGDASQADVLSIASTLMAGVVPGVSGAWFLPDVGLDRLVAAEAFGSAAPLLRGMSIGVGDRLTGWVAATRQVIADSPAALDLGERASLMQPPMSRCLSVPLAAGDRLVAVLTLYATEHATLDAQHGRLLQIIAPHVAQALATAPDAASRPVPKPSARDLRLVARGGS